MPHAVALVQAEPIDGNINDSTTSRVHGQKAAEQCAVGTRRSDQYSHHLFLA